MLKKKCRPKHKQYLLALGMDLSYIGMCAWIDTLLELFTKVLFGYIGFILDLK